MWMLLAVLIVVGGAWIILQPLVSRGGEELVPATDDDDPARELRAEKDAVYAALKDLEFEYRAGKLSDEDFSELQTSYRARALRLLSASDAPGVAPPPDAPEDAAVGPVACAQCAQVNPSGSAFCSSCGAHLVREGVCSTCGGELEADDRFCMSCGAAVPRAAASQQRGEMATMSQGGTYDEA